MSLPQEESRIDRRTAILDAAEEQFAAYGYDGVTLRAIAKKAGVDLALPNYYFGPKRDLFDAVLMRRAEILNAARLAQLDECIASSNGTPSVENIIRAFLRPLLTGEHVSEQGWKNYYALIAYVNNSPEWGGRLMTQFFDPVIQKFIDALRLAMPEVEARDIYWAYHFLSGALTLTFAQTGRLDTLSGGLCRSDDLTDAFEHMVRFTTAGFETFRSGQKKRRPR
ncbi:MAG TPA: TetR/AcrR family transcriptional regulator [Hyphomonas sp.]|nr:TetR family transcriptional regulator [Hyphomonas sp.]MCB9961678.1 TetR/AcrR family transcriptional regulator [Hyphomonas sp.]MCB9971235.1 TetR/AcrR family transcriptional regulator [Hyphomonas sp.]MCC0050304.1 TetR/AcrR family transcriptional regulator [Rhodobiaceae bacterium]HPE48208.1 TetR/AcrR family transcriptional regulator [Hyphomonas sp.]